MGLRRQAVCLQVHSKALDTPSGLAETLKALSEMPIVSILGVALKERPVLKKNQIGEPCDQAAGLYAFRSLVKPILDLTFLSAEILCMILPAG